MSVNEVRKPTAPIDFEVRNTNGTTGPLSSTSATFVLGNEDHTLGNALRHVLLERPDVGFAGYAVPHPSEPVVQIRLQTRAHGKSGAPKPTAISVLKSASRTLADVCDLLIERVEEAIPEVVDEYAALREVQEGENDGDDGDDAMEEEGSYDGGYDETAGEYDEAEGL
eukprot:CAMPEP_0194266462 /NCGR_PEP_ID=MMETSP0169-20130528/1352_1 /TAXON_ID=218684 /ORGANISM="Corethron pennatum, Strain L29A3" /LENGTH=167 /DNA_ID=CAMNT_0039007143 /DNA_START=60 /DNA_END=563 /DNA_ORIENTATION=+